MNELIPEDIQMQEINFYILSLQHQCIVKFPQPTKIEEFNYLFEFLSIFGDYNHSIGQMLLKGLMKYDNDLKGRVGTFISTHIKHDQKLSTLGKFFGKIDLDTWIAITPADFSREQLDEAKHALLERNIHGYSKESHNETNELKDKVEANFKIRIFDHKSDPVGKKDKAERRCLFCGKDASEGATFQQVAHAVPESLGNKHLISYEECDACNQSAGKDVDSSVGIFWMFERIYFGLNGKGGAPVIKTEGLVNLERNQDGLVVRRVLKEGEDPESLIHKFDIMLPGKVRLQDVYRCFAKSSIALLGHEFDSMFAYTKQWVARTISIGKLPRVAVLMHNEMRFNHPLVAIYCKTSAKEDIPNIVFEIKFGGITIAAIIPTSQDEAEKFNNKSNFEEFWNQMPHYSATKKWVYLDLSNDEKNSICREVVMTPSEAGVEKLEGE